MPVVTIPLGYRLPDTSCGLPGSHGGPDQTAAPTRCWCLLPAWPCTQWGLPSQTGHPACWCALTAPFHPYPARAVRQRGGLFSVALSLASRLVGVTHHWILWCPDFPPASLDRARAATQSTSPRFLFYTMGPSEDMCRRWPLTPSTGRIIRCVWIPLNLCSSVAFMGRHSTVTVAS